MEAFKDTCQSEANVSVGKSNFPFLPISVFYVWEGERGVQSRSIEKKLFLISADDGVIASYTPTATTSGARQTGDDGARSTNTASAISSGAGAQQTGDSGAAQVGGSNGWWMAVVVGAVGLAGAL